MANTGKQVVGKFLIVALLLGWQFRLATAAITAIRIGKLVDGTGQSVTNAVVVVDGDRILSVGKSTSSVPAGAKVIDLSEYTVIPGLIDVHTHATFYWDEKPGTTPYR
jgi:imidazolonepropionase-like amidohydrolase